MLLLEALQAVRMIISKLTGSFLGVYIVGYLNDTTGGFGASYIFMAGSLFLSAIITMVAVKGTDTNQVVVS